MEYLLYDNTTPIVTFLRRSLRYCFIPKTAQVSQKNIRNEVFLNKYAEIKPVSFTRKRIHSKFYSGNLEISFRKATTLNTCDWPLLSAASSSGFCFKSKTSLVELNFGKYLDFRFTILLKTNTTTLIFLDSFQNPPNKYF